MPHQRTVGVDVRNNEILLATVECNLNKKMINKLKGINLRPEM